MNLNRRAFNFVNHNLMKKCDLDRKTVAGTTNCADREGTAGGRLHAVTQTVYQHFNPVRIKAPGLVSQGGNQAFSGDSLAWR